MTDSSSRIGYQRGIDPLNNVINHLERHKVAFPTRTALRWVDRQDLAAWDKRLESILPHREISYGDFAAGVHATAKGLADLGIGFGDRVIIFLPMGCLMYTAMFAVQQLGAIAVFLDSWARRNHLGASAQCVQPKAMISHRAAFDLINEVPEFAAMKLRIIAGPGRDGSCSAQLEELLRTRGDVPLAAVESEYTALITFTTGSSGKPKGANRTHRFLCAQHEALNEVLPYTERDSDLPAFPIFSLNNLAAGVTTIIPALDLAAPSEHDAALLVAQLVQQKITCTTLSPSMLVGVAKFCAAKGVKLSSVRRVVTGGAPISKGDVAGFQQIAPDAEIWVLYGSTEVEPIAHIEGREMLKLQADPDPEIVEEGVNVGHISEALRYKFIKLVDGPIDLERTPWKELEMPAGEVGEFLVTGDHVCRDYYNDDDAFRRAKVMDHDRSVWHRTGDLARIDAKGYLWIVGRMHNVVRRGDRYYFPVRAEVILKRVPGVSHGAFLGLPDARLGERTTVVCALTDKAHAARAREEILRLFEKNSIPVDCLYFVDRIPMDPRHHSKVEYGELKALIETSGAKDQRHGVG